MRHAFRLLASVKPQYLDAGQPTGLAGLFTHRAPRSALLYLYSATLDKLKQYPEHSVYRQSTEALTRHRLNIIENTKPTGLEAWQERVQPMFESHPKAFQKLETSDGKGYNIIYKQAADAPGPIGTSTAAYKVRSEDDLINEAGKKAQLVEGPKFEDEYDSKKMLSELARDPQAEEDAIPKLEPEPPLSVDQIGDIEQKIGAGLIEEVIQVAEGELQLANVMAENKAWEDLEEKPQEGQWAYHERDTNVGTTQAR